MTAFLLGLLMALVGLIIALVIGNVIIFILLHDLPWLRLFQQLHDVETFKNLGYVPGEANHKNRLDIYRPKGKKRYPVVVFVHGGYWNSGDKEYYLPFTGLYANIGIALARKGVGAVVTNYRLAPAVTFDKQLGDVLAAIRWTRAHIGDYEGDPERLFIMGHSAGGHIAALIAADGSLLKDAGIPPEAVKGYVLLSAIYDLDDMAKKNDATFNEHVTRMVFGSDPAALVRWSPIARFRLRPPPILMLTAERDFPYLIPQEEGARRKLAELHADPSAYTIPGYAHMDMVMKFGMKDDEVLRRTLEFIDAKQ